jgi:uncharacterized protein YwbE
VLLRGVLAVILCRLSTHCHGAILHYLPSFG